MNQNGYAKILELQINGFKIKTPILWFTQLPSNQPNLHENVDIDGLMVNAYHIYSQKARYKKLSEKKNIFEFFGLKNKPIILDSGGFLFQKNPKIHFSVQDLLDIYELAKPTFCFTLDIPLDLKSYQTGKNNSETERRWKQTFENTEELFKKRNKLRILPILHCINLGMMKKRIKQLENFIEMTKEFNNLRIPMVAIGSIVPLLRSTGQIKNGRYLVAKLISNIREILGDSLIHVFGVGGTTTMHTLFYLGADSLDSSAWRMKASRGAFQLPGVGDRFIHPPKGYQKMSKDEEKKLLECRCLVCKGNSLLERKAKLNNRNPKTFANRAIHNAWVLKEEVEYARREIMENNYEKFIFKRLKRSSYLKFIRIAENEIKNKHLIEF